MNTQWFDGSLDLAQHFEDSSSNLQLFHEQNEILDHHSGKERQLRFPSIFD